MAHTAHGIRLVSANAYPIYANIQELVGHNQTLIGGCHTSALCVTCHDAITAHGKGRRPESQGSVVPPTLNVKRGAGSAGPIEMLISSVCCISKVNFRGPALVSWPLNPRKRIVIYRINSSGNPLEACLNCFKVL